MMSDKSYGRITHVRNFELAECGFAAMLTCNYVAELY
jgi:hypothetical protein